MTLKSSIRLAASLGLASLIIACSSADPSPDPEPTAKQGEQLLPVTGGGGGGDGPQGGKLHPCDPYTPTNANTWYCGPQSLCLPNCGPYPEVAVCDAWTGYKWDCFQYSPGTCSHGCLMQ
jgi:hypothetical protein